MSHHHTDPHTPDSQYVLDALRLEAVTTCVGFDDMLDVTLTHNMPHVDNMIVITGHDDRATQKVAKKHGAMLVVTDLFHKNGRNFNKGAAINAGFNYFQFRGWRLHLDSDIALPDNFRRILFNRTHLDLRCIYGADRLDVIGLDELTHVRSKPQFSHNCHVWIDGSMGHRFIDHHHGYCPIGFFQLWHARHHHGYPYSLGTAAHDDTMFSAQWREEYRRHLPTVVVQHLLSKPPRVGENWDGHRRQPRLK